MMSMGVAAEVGLDAGRGWKLGGEGAGAWKRLEGDGWLGPK